MIFFQKNIYTIGNQNNKIQTINQKTINYE